MGERDLSVLVDRRATLRMIPGGAAAPRGRRRDNAAGTGVRPGCRRPRPRRPQVPLDGQPAARVAGDGEPGRGALTDVPAPRTDVVLAHGSLGHEPLPRDCRPLTIGGPDDAPPSAQGRPPATAAASRLASAVVMTTAGCTVAPGPDPAPRPAAVGLLAVPVVSDAGLEHLTDHERQVLVLVLVADGPSNAEIAGSLTLSGHTVETHVQNLLGELRPRDRVHAVIYAYETGLRTPR